MEKPGTESGKKKKKHQGFTEMSSPDKCKVQQDTRNKGPSSVKEAGRDPQGPSKSPKKVKTDRQLAEERHFYALFSEVIDIIQKSKKICDDEVTWGVDDILSSFHYDQGGRFFDVDYTQYENVCAYLFRLGSHGAGLARCKVLEAAKNCKALKQALCKVETRSELRLVSLGGGPGNDALGFCSALMELQFPQRRAVDITIVDLIPQWAECVDHVDHLLRQGDFGDVSKMFQGHRVNMKFWQARLPTLGAAHKDALASADVILMTRLLSSLEGNVWDIVENLHSTMKDTTLLVLIDSPFQPDLWKNFDILYLSEPERCYQALEVHRRFGQADNVRPSKARVAVLSKHLDVTSDSDITD